MVDGRGDAGRLDCRRKLSLASWFIAQRLRRADARGLGQPAVHEAHRRGAGIDGRWMASRRRIDGGGPGSGPGRGFASRCDGIAHRSVEHVRERSIRVECAASDKNDAARGARDVVDSSGQAVGDGDVGLIRLASREPDDGASVSRLAMRPQDCRAVSPRGVEAGARIRAVSTAVGAGTGGRPGDCDAPRASRPARIARFPALFAGCATRRRIELSGDAPARAPAGTAGLSGTRRRPRRRCPRAAAAA